MHPDGSVIAGDIKTFAIPRAVVDALANPVLVGADNVGQVSGLLVLANRALGGLPTGSASLGEISAAVDAINLGFDNCRVLVNCSGGAAPVNLNLLSEPSVRFVP